MTQVDEKALVRKMAWRVLPFLLLVYQICIIDRLDPRTRRRPQRHAFQRSTPTDLIAGANQRCRADSSASRLMRAFQ